MKTAISIPDLLFRRADRAARRLGMSRSQLYAVAIEAFLADQEQADVTAALDRIYGREPSALESAAVRMQAAAYPARDSW